MTLTIATEVVGEITALMAMASPRPRRTVPLPRSKGSPQIIRWGDPFQHLFEGRVGERRAGGVLAAFAHDVLAPEFERVDLERPRHHVGVALIGPDELGTPKPRSAPDGG